MMYSSPPFIQLKLSYYQSTHIITSPGFPALSNLVPSYTRRRRYIPTQRFRTPMPRGGSKTIPREWPKAFGILKFSPSRYHQSLEYDHALPSISISETSQGILSLFYETVLILQLQFLPLCQILRQSRFSSLKYFHTSQYSYILDYPAAENPELKKRTLLNQFPPSLSSQRVQIN